MQQIIGSMKPSKLLIGLLLLSGTFIQGKSVQDETSRIQQQSSSRSGSRLRVMVHKEFQLQPDGTYKEIPSSGNKKLTLINDNQQEVEESESAPQLVYSPYYGRPKTYSRVNFRPQQQQQQYSFDDILPQSSYSRPQYAQADVSNSFQSSETTYPEDRLARNSFAEQLLSGNAYASPDNVTGAESENYQQRYEVSAIPSQQYYVDEIPQSAYRNHYNKQRDVNNVQNVAAAGGYNTNNNGPSNIQEILKKPAESMQSHYYSPKDNVQYYGTTGGGDYGVPNSGYQDSYGVPPASDDGGYNNGGNVGGYVESGGHGGNAGNAGGYVESGGNGGNVGGYVESGGQGGGWSGGGGHSGGHSGGKGNIVNGLISTVTGVAGQKAAQFGNIVQQKGEVGSQILNQGGRIVQSTVQQKAVAAKAIGNALIQAPKAISNVIGAKARFASSALQYGTNTVGTIVRVKAQAAHQAAELIGAKGKAASAVIKATGGTAADLIVAKGKGLANLIRSGGKTATAILDSKGNTVQQIASAFAGKGNHGGGGGGGYGYSVSNSYGGDLGLGGGGDGWNDFAASAPAAQYGQRNAYDELQSALKAVAQSPASSYGNPPTEQLSNAFRSMYDSYYKNGNGPEGAHSSPVGVATPPASAPTSSESHEQTSEPKHSGTSIGDSLSKISKVFNNVATVLEKFNAPRSQ